MEPHAGPVIITHWGVGDVGDVREPAAWNGQGGGGPRRGDPAWAGVPTDWGAHGWGCTWVWGCWWRFGAGRGIYRIKLLLPRGFPARSPGREGYRGYRGPVPGGPVTLANRRPCAAPGAGAGPGRAPGAAPCAEPHRQHRRHRERSCGRTPPRRQVPAPAETR